MAARKAAKSTAKPAATTATKTDATTDNRGSAEAVKKRKAANLLNSLGGPRTRGTGKRDRFVLELATLCRSVKGENGRVANPDKPLTFLEQLERADYLLNGCGMSVTAMADAGIAFPESPVDGLNADVVRVVGESYDFSAEAWRILGWAA